MESELNYEEVEYRLQQLLEKYFGPAEPVFLAEKWKGGKMILQPANAESKPKELPIEEFFHKITMIRDRLRVLEQKINTHTAMNEAEKVEMQQYITRSYGTLTTFNILFRYSNQQFVGQKSE